MFAWIFSSLLYIRCLVLATFISGNTCSSNKCSIVTTSGRIEGDCSNGAVLKFFSIPYAQPPVGKLRLEDPVLFVQDSSTVVPAKSLPPKCPQFSNNDESEDCLYLNIWTATSFSISKPVFFWIHGGSNWQGSGSDPAFDGTAFSQSQDVVVITFNYRLGALGFFDDGTNTNFAVKDTMMALKWVKDNIASFGGNPDLITVFGNSSAGSIIRALMSIAGTRGLFNKAIIQSDPAAFGFTKREVSRDTITKQFLSYTNCTNKACLKNTPLSNIVDAQLQTLAWMSTASKTNLEINAAYPFGPVIDSSLITKDYSAHLASGTLPNQVDMIIGFTKDEAGPTINTVLSNPAPPEYWPGLLMSLVGPQRAQTLLSTNVYQLDGNADATRNTLIDFGTDYYWKCPNEYNAGLIANNKQSKVYVYELGQGIEYIGNTQFPLCNGRVCHQDDLYLTFGTYDKGSTSQEKQQLSASIQSSWAKFARYGSPFNCGSGSWPASTSSSTLNVCHLGQSQVTQLVRNEYCQALNQIQYPFQLFSS